MNKLVARSLALLFVCFALATTATAQASAKGFIGLAMLEAPNPRGVTVAIVKPGGPADRAGVKRGDIIVEINGTKVKNAEAVTRMIAAMQPNQLANLSVIREGGAPADISIVVGSPDGVSEAPLMVPPTIASNAGVPPSIPEFTRIQDPIEQAFTVEVPSGWDSVAGLARRSALQINPFVRSLSPDKMTYLMLGEPTTPSFTPPSRMGNVIGNREGTLYNAGLGGLALVLRYLPGPQYAKAYGETMLKGMCPNLQFVSSQDRPDLALKAQAIFPAPAPSRYDGGEARFTCMHNKQEMEVRVEAATTATRNNIMWGVVFIRAYITPKGQGDRAEAALVNISRSMVFNPQWIQMQNNLSQQAAIAINARMQEFFRQERTFIDKLNSVDQNFESMDEIISGFSSYKDGATGNTYSLSNTSPYKWYDDSSGRIISTDTDAKPFWAPGLRALPRVSQ